MFQVNLGQKIIYYPANDDYAIYDTEVTEDVGQAGEFTFKVPPTNPLYAELTTGALVTILKDGKEFWRGEIRDISVDFAKIANVYCVEDLVWLSDEFIPPSKIINQSYKQRLDSVIATYNSSRGQDRQFKSGYVYNGSNTCNWTTEYEWSILESIRRCICRDDLYIRVRRVYENGVIQRYIDVVRLQDYGKVTSQPIEYGYNLLDYVKESDYGNLTNVVTPYGDELDNSEVYDDYATRLQGTTIANNASIETYGRHAKAVVFNGVTDINSLNSLAQSYLTRYSQPQLTMEVNAVDLSVVENIDSIEIGDQVRVIAKPFAVDQYLYLTQITRDLQNIDKNTITLSGHVTHKTLTSQINNTIEAVEEIPSKWSLLDAAKKNALAMLLDETQGGYVVYEYDASNQYIEAINICNARTIEASTQRWRWGSNGLGYMERANIGSSWSTIKVAMTKDGHIVGDFVDTGTLTAAIIKAGILTDKNGQFSLNMETGALTMNSGTFKGSLQAATGTFAGSLQAATGSFSGTVTANNGKIGDFTISGGNLQVGDGILSRYLLGCGSAGSGIVNLVGNKSESDSRYGYIQISNSGDPDHCIDGIRIYGNGIVERYDGSGNLSWDANLSALQ